MSVPVVLAKESFRRSIRVKAVVVPARACKEALPLFKSQMMKMKNVKPVAKHTDDTRRILLQEGVDVSSFSATQRAFLESGDARLEDHALELGYENMSADEVLREVLPEGVTIPSAFDAVGHIAHFNLRDDQLPYRHLIGQVVLDKASANIKTVVNKLGSIQSEFRTFDMEVLAGEDRTRVELFESGCRFRFDLRTVYWNSRLQMEHRKIVSLLSPADVVCDMMCGVGPFAVPAAKAGLTVHANDLNPASHAALVENVRINKVPHRVTCYNLDAREFVRRLDDSGVPYTTVLMNLPAIAIEFLDAFREWSFDRAPPMIYCYAFADPATAEHDLRARAEAALGRSLPTDTEFRVVRDVAPHKLMYCVTFRLPPAGSGAGAGQAGDAEKESRQLDGRKRSRAKDGAGAGAEELENKRRS